MEKKRKREVEEEAAIRWAVDEKEDWCHESPLQALTSHNG